MLALSCLALALCVAGAQGLAPYSVVCQADTAAWPDLAHVVVGLHTPDPACKVYAGTLASATGTALVDLSQNSTGWIDLRLFTPRSPNPPGLDAYASGFLEGYLTAQAICDFSHNLQINQFGNSSQLRSSTVAFLNDNMAWAANNSATNSSLYWEVVSDMFSKIHGMSAGQVAAQGSSGGCTVSLDDLLIINAQGDLGDIMEVVSVSSRPSWWDMSKDDVIAASLRRSHCTVAVRFLPDMSDLLTAHTTWSSYTCMNRVFKAYTFPDPLEQGKNLTIQLSSYPGSVSSTDDFFQVSSGLVVSETTNDVFNNSLYDSVTPRSLLSWTRAVAACVLSRSGPRWADMFGWFNSGTYSNMWIVVDYNRFVTGTPLLSGAVTIAEQLPGIVAVNDVTDITNYGCFPSYNVPYDQRIYQMSGVAAMEAKYGNYFSYHGNPRATIFRRDALTIMSVEDLKSFMRYNEYETDPLSLGSAANQIAARYDLVNVSLPHQISASAGGAFDAKVTSSAQVMSGVVWAVSGPSHQTQPVFEWAGRWDTPEYPHQGQAELWNFEYVKFAM